MSKDEQDFYSLQGFKQIFKCEKEVGNNLIICIIGK